MQLSHKCFQDPLNHPIINAYLPLTSHHLNTKETRSLYEILKDFPHMFTLSHGVEAL